MKQKPTSTCAKAASFFAVLKSFLRNKAFKPVSHLPLSVCLAALVIYNTNAMADSDAVQNANQLELTQLILPVPPCGLGLEYVTIKVKNTGTSSLSNIPVKYTINDDEVVVSEIITSTINAGQTATFTFNMLADFTPYTGNMQFIVKAEINLENNGASDTVLIDTIDSYPTPQAPVVVPQPMIISYGSRAVISPVFDPVDDLVFVNADGVAIDTTAFYTTGLLYGDTVMYVKSLAPSGCPSALIPVQIIIDQATIPPYDLEILNITHPVGQGNISDASDHISVRVRNRGTEPLSGAEFKVSVSDGTTTQTMGPVMCDFSSVLNPYFGTTTVSFSTSGDIIYGSGEYCHTVTVNSLKNTSNNLESGAIAAGNSVTSCAAYCFPNSTILVGAEERYTDLTSLVSDLAAAGICGPIVVSIKPGTYNEQIEIPEIYGASATNTITFTSATGDNTSVVLSYSPTDLASNFVVRLNNAQYIEFKNMTIQAEYDGSLGVTGKNVEIIGDCTGSVFENNIFSQNLQLDNEATFAPAISFTSDVQFTDNLFQITATDVVDNGPLATGDGILWVEALNGAVTTDGSFALPNGSVDIGNYTYKLYRGGTPSGTENNRYLRNVTPIISLTGGSKTYDGTPLAIIASITPNTLTLTYSYEGTLKDGTAYSPTAQPPTDAGDYTVTASTQGDADYISASAQSGIEIIPKAIDNVSVTVNAIADQPYTGSDIEPLPVVTDNTTTLIKDTDYALSYSDNINIGTTATVTITGMGNYSGSREVNFTIGSGTDLKNTTVAGTVYPNPVKCGQTITVTTRLTDNAQLKIFDSNGLLIDSRPITGEKTEITMPNVPGIYLIKVYDADKEETVKVVVN